MKKLIATIVFLCSFFCLYSQQISDETIKVALVYKILQNLEWDKEQNIRKYNIAVLTESNSLLENFKKLEDRKLKEKPISVIGLKNLNKVPAEIQVLYLDDKHSFQTDEVLKTLQKDILLVSDMAPDQRYVMINLLRKENKISFEIHKANLINAGIAPSSSLILLGGSEIDVAKLYKETQSSLESEREKVKLQASEISRQRAEIERQNKEIERQQAEIAKQAAEIEKQKLEIAQQREEIAKQKLKLHQLSNDIETQSKLLAEKASLLQKQTSLVEEQEKILNQQKDELEKRKSHLSNLLAEIKKQEEKIQEQRNILKQQDIQLNYQRNLIYLSSVIIFLFAGMIFFIYRNYRNKKKSAKILEQKNQQIEEQLQIISEQQNELKQKNEELLASEEELRQNLEELQAIQERLAEQNVLLSQKNQQILYSIRYAQTIQKAVLPTKEERCRILKESFLIYLPKDIVSGDFFWISQHDNLKIVGVIDCTGHGVPGAFMSLIGHSILNEIIVQNKVYNPAEILNQLHSQVIQKLNQAAGKNKDGMDLGIAVLDYSDNKIKLHFAGAKNNLILFSKHQLIKINGDRKNIGGDPNSTRSYTCHTLEVFPDDVFYLASDGFADQANPSRKSFGSHRFTKLLEEIHARSFSEQKEILLQELKLHQQYAEQRDDITLMGIKV
ncbi:MAG: YfiR/HmsC family protein [Cytophagales bacterium]|nr:YfiR/HmsC family protein [Cytophagales bacterium]MDW8383884.1 YfiR/HmsC family protein [Flammeovirgaceae bacterium]